MPQQLSLSVTEKPKVLSGVFKPLSELTNFISYFSHQFFFVAALGLRCCAQAFSSCSEWGLLLVAVRGLLIVVASLVVEHGL